MFWNGHGGGGTALVSSGAGNEGSGGWRPLYVKASGVTNASGSYDGRCGYSRSIPKTFKAVRIVSRTWSITLRITGAEFPRGVATGAGGWGSSSRYLFGKRDIRRRRTDRSLVGLWGSVVNTGPGGTEGGVPAGFGSSAVGAGRAASNGGFIDECDGSEYER